MPAVFFLNQIGCPVTKAAATASTTADPIGATTDFRHLLNVAAVAVKMSPVCFGQMAMAQNY